MRWETRTAASTGRHWVSLFVDPSPDTYKELVAEAAVGTVCKLGPLGKSEWLAPEYWHVTLLYNQAERDDPLIGEIIAKHGLPNDVVLHPSAIQHWDKGSEGFVVVKVESEQLSNLHRELYERIAQGEGYIDPYADPSIWTAHVTLFKYRR